LAQRVCYLCWCHAVQVIAGLKSDIEALESQSYELAQVRDELDMRKSQLETDNQELAVKKENLTGIAQHLFFYLFIVITSLKRLIKQASK